MRFDKMGRPDLHRRMRTRSFAALSFFLLLGLGDLSAALRVANAFGDHMVLQRDKPVRVWGWADAGAEVEVTFDGASVMTMAGDGGKWICALPAMKASFEGRELSVSSGNDSLTIKDVLVGEVWLCGGQSNMEWTLRGSLEADVEIDSADSPMIRFLRVPKVAAAVEQHDFEVPAGDGYVGRWQRCIPEEVENCTAVGYYFAMKLQRRLKVGYNKAAGLIDEVVKDHREISDDKDKK